MILLDLMSAIVALLDAFTLTVFAVTILQIITAAIILTRLRNPKDKP